MGRSLWGVSERVEKERRGKGERELEEKGPDHGDAGEEGRESDHLGSGHGARD